MSIIFRGNIFHTPKNPFETEGALGALTGAVAVTDGRIGAVGTFAKVQAQYPDAPVLGDGNDCLLPGFIDTHVHYPQVGVVGAMGLTLLDWLKVITPRK